MKKIMFFKVFIFVIVLSSCSSYQDEYSEEKQENKYCDVNFDLTGDFIDVEEKPMTRELVRDPKTYYYIKIIDRSIEEEYGGTFINIGHVGFFTDLKYARLRLQREHTYDVEATALIESETIVDVDENSNIGIYGPHGLDYNTYNIYNKFSDYLTVQDIIGADVAGAVNSPMYEDESVDRFFSSKSFYILSNETLEMNLNRFSYKLQLEIDPPVDGYIELSCNVPAFMHRAYTNESHSSISHIYSLAGKDISNAAKTITLKLEKFSTERISESVSTKDITVKPNVETTLRVNFDNISANNGFRLTLNDTPMGKENISWN